MNKSKIKRPISIVLILAMIASLMYSTFSMLAFFTDREEIQTSGDAGTVMIGLSKNGIKLTDAQGKDIMNPGDKRDITYTISSLGNKSIDVRETIVLTVYDKDGQPLNLSDTQSEFEIYDAADVEEVEGQGWMPKADKQPLDIKSLKDNVITYVRPDFVLSGGGDGEREIETDESGEIPTTKDRAYALIFKAASGNKFQLAMLKMDVIVEAKQHRNTAGGWDLMVKTSTELSNGNTIDTVLSKNEGSKGPDYTISNGEKEMDKGTADDIFEWTENEDGTITISGLTGTGVLQDKIDIPSKIDGKDVSNVDLDKIKDQNPKADIDIPKDTVDKILNNGKADKTLSNIVNEKLTNEVWEYTLTSNTESGEQFITLNGLTEYGKNLSSITTPASIDGVPVKFYTATNRVVADNVRKITITKNIEKVGESSFASAFFPNLNEVEMRTGDDVVFNGYYGPFTEYKGTTIKYTNSSLTKLPAKAFYGATKMTTYSYPETVKEIGDYAFANCVSLTSIDLTGIESIGASAFESCRGLTAITIPDTVKSIGASAFESCTGITDTIIVPESVKSIGQYVFSGITAPVEMRTGDDVVFNGYYGPFTEYKGTTIKYTNSSLTKLPAKAFYGATKMTTYSYPRTVKEIGDYAFAGCKLTSLVILENVEKLGSNIIDSSTIDTVQVQSKNITLTNNTWLRANKLTTLDYSNPELTSVPAYAFANLTNIESITIDDRFTEIGNYAFSGATRLNKIDGAANIKVIGANAFYGCSGFTGEFVIPEKTEIIKESAFSRMSNITKIVLPETVKEIGDRAFSWMNSLTEINIPNGVETVGNTILQGSKVATIHYSGSLDLTVKNLGAPTSAQIVD
ncbi:leucine-rich repeat domain-containing protein [Oscillibacter sp. MSJ-31]|uniref:leucine-rich repeat domain-containing protein n=1 Tax=Oscillibacter sp. MSJ-31 TaxID=2841526 RepID=UPI001C126E98|nr:leucine-rich repeat domain-containing protein [Oscillibacter sp. MSJ-31]MBU5457555.1 leucine-rich repeat domain-containing protein [Oscillibacter sp. MSJ-31]